MAAAILDAIEKKTVGNPEFSNQQNFANRVEAAKQAGLGNKETARQATKVVHEGTAVQRAHSEVSYL